MAELKAGSGREELRGGSWLPIASAYCVLSDYPAFGFSERSEVEEARYLSWLSFPRASSGPEQSAAALLTGKPRRAEGSTAFVFPAHTRFLS